MTKANHGDTGLQVQNSICVVITSRGKPSTTVFPTLVASPQTPYRAEEKLL